MHTKNFRILVAISVVVLIVLIIVSFIIPGAKGQQGIQGNSGSPGNSGTAGPQGICPQECGRDCSICLFNYKCIKNNGQAYCVLDKGGEFSSLNDCTKGCSIASEDLKYSCTGGSCVYDPINGTSLEKCTTACKSKDISIPNKYSCVHTQNGQPYCLFNPNDPSPLSFVQCTEQCKLPNMNFYSGYKPIYLKNDLGQFLYSDESDNVQLDTLDNIKIDNTHWSIMDAITWLFKQDSPLLHTMYFKTTYGELDYHGKILRVEPPKSKSSIAMTAYLTSGNNILGIKINNEIQGCIAGTGYPSSVACNGIKNIGPVKVYPLL